jgi:hypothetical protein
VIGFGEIALEGIEPLAPELAVVADPVGGLCERRGLEAAVPHPTFLLRPNQSRSLQGIDVFHDRGQGHGDRPAQSGDRGFAQRQPGQDRPPRGIGQRREGRVQGFHIVNH